MSLAALIAAQRVEYGIPHAVACRALTVSQAWFYKWRRGDGSLRRKRRAALAGAIGYLFTVHHGSCGGGYTATVHIRPRRARLRARPSGLKGRCAIATRDGPTARP